MMLLFILKKNTKFNDCGFVACFTIAQKKIQMKNAWILAQENHIWQRQTADDFKIKLKTRKLRKCF